MSVKAEMSFTKWVKQEWKKPGDVQPTIEAEYIIPVVKKGNDHMFDFVNAERLIRCRDCKYNSNTEGNYVNCDIIPQMFGKTPDDNYCSWAESEETES